VFIDKVFIKIISDFIIKINFFLLLPKFTQLILSEQKFYINKITKNLLLLKASSDFEI
jgi:hypothetical protein